jgi:hypothetical protein
MVARLVACDGAVGGDGLSGGGGPDSATPPTMPAGAVRHKDGGPMTWLVEDPWPILWVAGGILAVLAVAFYHTRSRAALATIAVVLVIGLAGLAVERLVVTEREEVENTLYGAAAALVKNDPPQVLAFVSEDADEMRRGISAILPRFEIREAKVGGNLKIKFNRVVNPPTATATFIGRVKANYQDPSRQMPYDNFVRQFTVRLRQEGDRWLLYEYSIGSSAEELP